MMNELVAIRQAKPEETMLLTEFLYEAIYQPNNAASVARTILQEPMIWAYVKDFGTQPDDLCFVAVANNLVVGAAWTRRGCSYGKVDESTPELAISLYPEYRGKGIGTRLLSALLDSLSDKDYPKVSKTNFALKLYRKSGFEILAEREHDYLMIKQLK